LPRRRSDRSGYDPGANRQRGKLDEQVAETAAMLGFKGDLRNCKAGRDIHYGVTYLSQLGVFATAILPRP